MQKLQRMLLAVGAVAFLGLPVPSYAADRIWNSPNGGAFAAGKNWNPTPAPRLKDVARFNLGDAYTVTLPLSRSIGRFLIGNDKLVIDLSGGGKLNARSTSATSFVMANKQGNVARLTVKNGTLTTVNTVFGAAKSTSASINVGSGATWNNTGAITLGTKGAGNITIASGGHVTAASLRSGMNAGTRGTTSITGNGSLLTVTSGILGSATPSGTSGTGQLLVRQGSTLSVIQTMEIRKGGVLRLEGGTVTAGSILNSTGGAFSFLAGTINLNSVDLLVDKAGPLTDTLSLSPAQTINVANNVQVSSGALLLMMGGKLTSSEVFNSGELRFSEKLDDPDHLAQLVTKVIFNSGLIGGTGRTGADLNNSGTVQVANLESLGFGGSANNSGHIATAEGGVLSFDQPLGNSGEIATGGELHVPAGLSNTGKFTITAGLGVIEGTFSNTADGSVDIAGPQATFQKEVTHNGAAFSVHSASTATFEAPVHGAGEFSGGGTLLFQSSYSPGNSPATVHAANNLQFAPNAELNLEMGPGRAFDQLFVDGSVTLGQVNILFDPAFDPSGGVPGGVLQALAGDGGGSGTGGGNLAFAVLTANQINYLDPEHPLDGIHLINAPEGYELKVSPTAIVVVLVPEPGAMLWGLGAIGLMLRRRRQPR